MSELLSLQRPSSDSPGGNRLSSSSQHCLFLAATAANLGVSIFSSLLVSFSPPPLPSSQSCVKSWAGACSPLSKVPSILRSRAGRLPITCSTPWDGACRLAGWYWVSWSFGESQRLEDCTPVLHHFPIQDCTKWPKRTPDALDNEPRPSCSLPTWYADRRSGAGASIRHFCFRQECSSNPIRRSATRSSSTSWPICSGSTTGFSSWPHVVAASCSGTPCTGSLDDKAICTRTRPATP